MVEALSKSRELEISFRGRKTGKIYSAPVWFAYEDERIFLLPVSGSDTNWYRNIQKNPILSISIAGKTIELVAKPLIEKRKIEKVVKMFKSKYGEEDIDKWYSKLDVAAELPLPR